MHHDEIQVGWTVYDADNEKVGDVADVTDDFVLMQKGLIFIKDVYVPIDEIRETDAANACVYLDVRKSEIDRMGWDAPPSDGMATSASASTSGGAQYGNAASADTAADGDRQRLTLHEEELQAQTRRAQTGEVAVSKRVVEDQQELDVPVTHEEVDVRRVRVDREATPDDAAFTDDGKTIRVPVTSEQVEVTKQPRVAEEIEITKRPVTERQRVSDTVRREEADVSQEGDVSVGDTSRDLVGSGADRIERTNLDDLDDAEQERRDTRW